MLSRFLFHPDALVLIESSTSVSRTFEICMRHIIAIYPWPFSMTDFLHPSPPTHIIIETTNSQTGNGGQQQLQQHECVLVCQHGQIITTAFDSLSPFNRPSDSCGQECNTHLASRVSAASVRRVLCQSARLCRPLAPRRSHLHTRKPIWRRCSRLRRPSE